MNGVVTRAGLFSAAAFAVILGIGTAYAGPAGITVGSPPSPQIVAFNSLTNMINHDEGIVTFGGGALAASFTMPSGNAIQTLGLDLSCDGKFGVSNTCTPSAYSS